MTQTTHSTLLAAASALLPSLEPAAAGWLWSLAFCRDCTAVDREQTLGGPFALFWFWRAVPDIGAKALAGATDTVVTGVFPVRSWEAMIMPGHRGKKRVSLLTPPSKKHTVVSMKTTLGKEIKRLRLEAGFTLRAFAESIDKSPPYQSDIEHDRRMPSEQTLRDMVEQLKQVGATYEGFKQYDGRFDQDVKELVVHAPEANGLLRAANQLAEESDVPLNDILRELKENLEKRLRKEG